MCSSDLLSVHRINWGTYQDALGSHCNAHANNFVVLPPAGAAHDDDDAPLLAACDFDMAFPEDTYLGTQNAAEDAACFEQLIGEEPLNLAMTLAGDTAISSGVTARAAVPRPRRAWRWAWRDAVLAGYVAAGASASACASAGAGARRTDAPAVVVDLPAPARTACCNNSNEMVAVAVRLGLLLTLDEQA